MLALCFVSVSTVSCVVLHDPLGSVMEYIAQDYHFEQSDPEEVMVHLLCAHGCTADSQHVSELLDRIKSRMSHELRLCTTGMSVQDLVGAVYEEVEQYVYRHGKTSERKLYGHAIVLTLCLLGAGILSYFVFNHFNNQRTDDRRALQGHINQLSDRVEKERNQVGTLLQAVVQKQNRHESVMHKTFRQVHAEQELLKENIEVLAHNDTTLHEQMKKTDESIRSVDEKVDQQDAYVTHVLEQLCSGVERNQEDIAATSRTTQSVCDHMQELHEVVHEKQYEVDEKLHFLKRKQEGLETEAALNRRYDDLRFDMQEKMRKQQASFEQQQRERQERSMENLFESLVKNKENISRIHERTSDLKSRVVRQEDKKGFLGSTFDTVKSAGEAAFSLGKGAASMFNAFGSGMPGINPMSDAGEYVASFFRKKKRGRRRCAAV